MKRHLLFWALLFWLPAWLAAQPCREVMAYFPGWKWYHRNFLVNPLSIHYDKYTAIIYAFFDPQPDGSILPFDPQADKILLLGPLREDAPAGYRHRKAHGDPRWHHHEESLVYRAHASGVKVLVSIGGWTLSKHFSTIAASEQRRRRFAESCAQIVQLYQVDGIDIDWEYPGYMAHGGSAADRRNFTLLLREVRQRLDELSSQRGQRLLLTAAFGVAPQRMAMIEWDEVVPLLDYVNLMTYDFYGSSYGQTNHHAPLYKPRQGIEGYDLESVVHHLCTTYGVPSQKVNIGIAFYGRSSRTRGEPGLHVATEKGPDRETFSEDSGAPMFYSILEKQHLFYYHWDHEAQAPWLRSRPPLNTFVSFEDENSVARKGRFILQENLAGAIIWDLTGDYIETRPRSGQVAYTPLAKALSDALCGRWVFEEDFNPTSFFSRNRLELLAKYKPRLEAYRSPPRLRIALSEVLSKKDYRKWLRKEKRKLKRSSKRVKYFYD
ncbi:MAG: hypothetical protein KatS3mg030_013 [Saprospiraceae bacterium]|nr:MAG: hypothetical protein KatS3mg030_013 [Saprospiraceae bacterium]